MNPNQRKGAIIEAATKCFAGRGYHATQISDIIKEAKIARGTFYLYFKSKYDIFNLILNNFISHLSSQIKNIELGEGKENPAVQMRKNVERVVDAVLKDRRIGKIVFNEAVGLDREIDKRLSSFYFRFVEMIMSSIRRGIGLGLVRKVDPVIAACIVLGGFREVIVQGTIFGNVKIKRDELVDGLIDVIFGGLGGRPMVG